MTNPYDKIAQDIDRQPSFKQRWIPRLIGGGFIALMVASAGAAVFPSLIKLTQPVLCSNGEIVTTKHHFEYGTTKGYTITVQCLKPDGTAVRLGSFLSFFTLFALLIVPCTLGLVFLGQLGKWHMIRKHGTNYKEVLKRLALDRRQRLEERRGQSGLQTSSSGDTTLSKKLSELDDARSRELLTESEYAAKKKEILSRF